MIGGNGPSASLRTGLDRVLALTSRSFVLSLKALPRATRATVAIAYLLARAADTVADTRLVPREQRLAMLRALAGVIRARPDVALRADVVRELGAKLTGATAIPPSHIDAERELVLRLGDVFAGFDALDELERGLVERLLATITAGMTWDLERFPGEDASSLAALDELEELDRYCYHVAGCVGEFWTDVHVARVASMRAVDAEKLRARAVRFGRALQMTNVLRDVPRDLAHGRCYLPRSMLRARGLEPRDLLDPRAWPRLRPLFLELLARTDEDAREGFAYTLELPARELGLRLATALPLLLAHPTLALLARKNALDPSARRKVSRREVWVAIVAASGAIAIDRALSVGALGRVFERGRRLARIGAAGGARLSSTFG